MYSSKTIHKNINPNYPQTYTSIGDPYNSTLEHKLPDRWKQKQFVTQKHPKNADQGYFGKMKYHPDPYSEIAEQYSETQPLEKRKLGFGSHDAFKSGEFMCCKATQRYRRNVKQEIKLLERGRDKEKERILLRGLKDAPVRNPHDKNGKRLTSPEFMYDIGRSCVTPYNPASAHDSFYNLPKHAKVDAECKRGKDSVRRLGSHRPMSATIGERAWSYKYRRPEHGSSSGLGQQFFDRGHLECKGFG